MYSGKSVNAVIRCNQSLMDELIDWFGKDFRLLENSNEEITIRVACNEQSLFYWALQYGMSAEILEPVELREKIKSAIRRMADTYGK